MKFARTVMLVCSTALAIPSVVMAAQETPAAPPAPRERPAPLTQEQWNAKVAENFKTADSKKDGKLTLEEYRTYLKKEEERRKSEREAAMFKRMDANNDGTVTEAEFKEAAFHFKQRGDLHHKGWGPKGMMHDGKGRMGPPPAGTDAPAAQK